MTRNLSRIRMAALALGWAVLAPTGVATGVRAETASEPRSITGTVVDSCVHSRGSTHCIQRYRERDGDKGGVQSLRERDDDALSESRERERQWVSRCQPALRHDRFGVGRYMYAAPGCEYGRSQD